MDKKAMHSLLEVQQFHQVLDASVMMPQSQSLGVTMDELSKLGASRSQHFGSSPGPRQPYNTSSTYRRFTKEDIASSAEKYSIQSIGDLVRRNQKLIGQATEMELENANLRAENVKLELRVGKQQQESTVQSDASSPRSSAKRSRVEGEPQQQRQTALTADAATLTDSASELLFWHEQSSSQSPFVTHAAGVDSAPHALSRSSQGAAVTATAEPLYWTLVNLLSESHRSLIAALDEQMAIVSGEHARNASDALLRSTVAYAARTLRAEYEATVAKTAYEEALEDLHVRDALVPQHLEAIRQIAEHALHRSRSNADAQSSETNSHNHVSSGSKHDSKDISLWNSFTQLLQSATAKEQMFTHLIQEAPTRSELSQTLVSIPEVKLREAEANLVEITTQLEQERSRSVVLADNLHREKLRHVETLERMWEAEQKVAEAEDSLKVMRQSSDCMFTRDQYDAVRTELAAAQMNLVQTQLALDALHDSSNQKLAEKSQALSAAQQEIDHLRHNAANLESQMAHAQSTNAALNQSLFEAHRDVQNAHAEAKLAIHHRLDMQQDLGSSQKLVEELKRALLSQECTEALLLSLFPADSSLEAVFARNRQMNMENVQLKEALAARDLQFVGVENQLVSLRAELRASEDNRQQALVELQLLHTSASAEEHKAASEAKRLALEVEGLQYRLASLQREKEQLQQREKVLEERVEVLAADPISMNVRKYGVERTRTIEQQMEEMNQRCVGLQGNVAELEAQRTTMNTTISTMANEIDVGSKRLNALDEQAADLRKTNETQQAKIESLLESETKLNEVVRSLESEISETSSALEAARQELVANVEAIKLAGVAEQRAKSNSIKLLDDNLALIQQVNDLTEVVTRIEAEHRNTKAQLASQTAALVAARSARPAVASAQPSTSSRKSAPSFAEASSWRTK
ncbi:Hypothetical protein, putative [Bodo saltans]|uniref:Uncharacterized protein n=1 Tax=Bodo saltans TaxID=75058 RepID=A0A0S4JKH8_BODSA|nr:Hypothetical protein, putative [Bodo saltans]|eukprot:CUG90754.1 Hypothetical protein, putative [Bodo saltans]